MLHPIKSPGNSGLLSLHEVERDRISVVSLNELETLGFKLLDLTYE
ncbi:MAG: hypothetical protein LCH36_10810 [Actinobacteria bacterium]|nr:hypothetical protein [Actinomycetota bacterium]